MAKELADVQNDEVREPGNDGGNDRGQESVRDSIRSAVKETNDKVEEREIKGEAPEKEDKEPKQEKVAKVDDKPIKQDLQKDKEPKGAEPDTGTPEVSEDGKPVIAADKGKEKAPAGLPKEVKDHWNALPPGVQQYVTRVQKEHADQKANLGRKEAAYREIDAAIAPHAQAIQQFGATPAQVVHRSLEWMAGLAGPQKVQYIQQLAQNFGIDLAQVVQPADRQYQDPNSYQPPANQNYALPPQEAARIANLEQTVTSFVQAQQDAGARAAEQVVNGWAASKPHFETVRKIMHGLIQNGTVPLMANGQIDLDAAYDAACHAHPETRALLAEEAEEAREAQATAAAAAKAKADALKVANAKKASSSFKPSAPASGGGLNGARQAKPVKNQSVGDGIRAAIQELRE